MPESFALFRIDSSAPTSASTSLLSPPNGEPISGQHIQPPARPAWTRQDPEKEWRSRTIDFHHRQPSSRDPATHPHGQPHGHLGSLPASAPRQNRRWPSSAAAVSRQPPSTHPSCPPVPRAIAESLQRQPFSLPLSLPFTVGLVSSTRWSPPPRKLIDTKQR